MKLISMTDFVLEEGNPSNTDSQFADKVMAYANFLRQRLKLWMFVPCKLVDSIWVVLEIPKGGMSEQDDRFHKEYQQAKNHCLFKEFEVVEMSGGLRIIRDPKADCQIFSSYNHEPFYKSNQFETVEDLVKYDLELNHFVDVN